MGIVKKTLQKAYEAREDPAIALLCLRTTPIETGLLSPAEMMFDRKIQSNLPTVNITEKDKACRQEQWKRQYSECSHTLKDLNRGQCVRVQDYTTKKWEPAVIDQKLSQPRSYMLTTNTGSQYRRNRRHILGQPQKCSETLRDTTTKAQRAIQHLSTEPIEQPTCAGEQLTCVGEQPCVGEQRTCVGDAPYQTRSGRSVRPPNRIDL